jgi:hypothetical protein
MAITGDREVLRMFEELPAVAQQRVLKPLLREGAALMAVEERAEAPRQAGLLQTAIGVSTLKSYPSGVLFIATGVRRGFKRAVQATSRGRLRFLGKRKTEDYPELPVQDPTKYLHLVTGGRKAISAMNKKVLYDRRTDKFFGKSVAAAAPNPFMDRAYQRGRAAAVAKITGEAPDRIADEAARIAANQ